MSYFGNALKTHRKLSGLTQEALALKMDYAQTNLSNIENSRKKPSLEVLKKLTTVPELALDIETLKIWLIIDEHGLELVRKAAKYVEDIE